MSWVRLDDQFHSHPKVIAGGNEVAGVYARSLAYCGAYHTDGFVSRKQAASFAVTRVLKRVTEAGFWDEVEPGQTRTVTGRRDSGNRPLADVTVTFDYYGFFIEDFLHHNPTRDEAEAAREKRRASGSKGGQANAQAHTEADAQALASQEVAEIASTPPSRPVLREQKPSIRLVGEKRQEILDDFEAKAKTHELTERQKARGRMLGPDRLGEVMLQVFSRGDVDNVAAYFVTAIENKHAESEGFVSGVPLEDRLRTYVLNEGHEYSDELLTADLRERGAKDAALIGRLIVYANELREAA